MFCTGDRFSLWNNLYIELGDQRDALSLCISQLLITEEVVKGSSYWCMRHSICPQEKRGKDHRYKKSKKTEKNRATCPQNEISAWFPYGDRMRDIFYLFFKQWKDEIFVKSQNDHFNISCQMAIGFVVQLLPVGSDQRMWSHVCL